MNADKRETPSVSKIIKLADYCPPDYLVEQIDLTFILELQKTTIIARSIFYRNPAHTATEQACSSLVLDGRDLILISAILDGCILSSERFHATPKAFTLIDPPQHFTLEITTEIEPQKNTHLEGLYKSGALFCTQCEAEGFRRITYFLDRPDVMALFTVRIEADALLCPILLANGNKSDMGILPEGRHFAVWVDPFPKPCYLFAMVAGALVPVEDYFITRTGRTVCLQIWVESGNENQCAHAMQSLKKAMRWDEEKYGLEYDLDIFMIVAVSDFNMGAMENKGLNIFNTQYVLAQPETATDSDYLGIESVIAHEYFHNWTGNRVTCRDWFQLSLKEGLTVYRDQEFSADVNSRPVKRISDVVRLRATQFPEDSGPMAHPVRPDAYIEISNFYTATIYEKGAELIRMYEILLGEKGFRHGLDLFFQRHDGQAVTTDDFMAAMADANDVDFSQFTRWYEQAGTPVVTVQGSYDPITHRYSLCLAQHTPPTPGQKDKKPLPIPIAIGLLTADGSEADLPIQASKDGSSDTPYTRYIINLTAAEQTITFDNIPPGPNGGAPVLSLLRGFSAPIRLETNLSDADLTFLMRHDRDPFARWEAGQERAMRLMLDLIAAAQKDKPLALDPDFSAAWVQILDDAYQDSKFKAYFLTLPSESDLAERMTVIDTDAIHHVRRFVATQLGSEQLTVWRDFYTKMQDCHSDVITGEAMGNRALGNRVLTYLALADPEAACLCWQQFSNSYNMTDRIAALSCLVDMEQPERTQALACFYKDWQNNPLVLDKWFSLQAMASRPDIYTQMTNLIQHPAFSLRNPNKVRALLGGFAFGNQKYFHAANGNGYQFLTDQIMALDSINPQIAARLAGAFGRWRRLDANRQDRVQNNLKRLNNLASLSRDLGEITGKLLA